MQVNSEYVMDIVTNDKKLLYGRQGGVRTEQSIQDLQNLPAAFDIVSDGGVEFPPTASCHSREFDKRGVPFTLESLTEIKAIKSFEKVPRVPSRDAVTLNKHTLRATSLADLENLPRIQKTQSFAKRPSEEPLTNSSYAYLDSRLEPKSVLMPSDSSYAYIDANGKYKETISKALPASEVIPYSQPPGIFAVNGNIAPQRFVSSDDNPYSNMPTNSSYAYADTDGKPNGRVLGESVYRTTLPAAPMPNVTQLPADYFSSHRYQQTRVNPTAPNNVTLNKRSMSTESKIDINRLENPFEDNNIMMDYLPQNVDMGMLVFRDFSAQSLEDIRRLTNPFEERLATARLDSERESTDVMTAQTISAENVARREFLYYYPHAY